MNSKAIIRILGLVITDKWKIYIGYVAMAGFAITHVLIAFALPYPLLRLDTILISALAFCVCIYSIKNQKCSHGAAQVIWLLKIAAMLFLIIFVAEVLGHVHLSSRMFIVTLLTFAIATPFVLALHFLHISIKWLFYSPPLWEFTLMRNDANDLIEKINFFIKTLSVIYILIPSLLVAWEWVDSYEAVIEFMSVISFDIGAQEISLNIILLSLASIYLTIIFSKILPFILLDEKISRPKN